MTAALFLVITTALICCIPLFLLFKAEKSLRKQTKIFSVALTAWLIFTFSSGKFGLFNDFTSKPPRMILMLICIISALIVLYRSKISTVMIEKISIRALIGVQMFRVFPELFLHLAYKEGLAPLQMTFHGLNFDIATAVLAFFIFVFYEKIPLPKNAVAYSFTIVGLILVTTIVVISMLSTPTFMRQFMNEPANTFVVHAPYIWLPMVHVLFAYWMHLLVFKKLKTGI